jgi:hypothetical protein
VEKTLVFCGVCEFALAKNVGIDQVQKMVGTIDKMGPVLQCPECKNLMN